MKELFSQADRAETTLLYKDGTTEKGRTIRMEIDYYKNVDPYSKDGYDYLPLFLRIDNADKNAVNELLNKTEKIYLDLIYGDIINRLSFRWGDLHQDQNYGFYIDLIGEIDSVEKINLWWEAKELNLVNKNIVLYLRKDYTDPIEEVNWDSTTNAFSYIIQQQFYEITPNPNAATTLYTDFNITSSKIITADNITTMRSDLNVISNNVDVMNVDVKDIRDNVQTLNSEMAETKEITQHLQKDVKKNRIIAGVALAFGILGTAGSAASIGMQLTSKGIQFASKNGYQFLSCCAAEPAEYEMNGTSILVGQLDLFGNVITRALTTDISPVLNWCNEKYIAIPDISVDDEARNPKTTACSLYTTIDMCNTFRDSLKPVFKLLAQRITEISSEVENLDFSDQLTTLETNFNNKLKEYVNHDELVRDDAVDIFPKVDNQNHILTFEFEGDTLYDGLLVFKIYAGAMVSQMLRRLYIKITDGQIVEYKGVQDNQITVDGITIEPAAKSEDYRIEFMPTAELDVDSRKKFIQIPIVDPTYKIAGAIIEQNTFKRQMVYTTNDIAYLQDIEALNKKIDALAEQSHTNDIQTFSIQDEMREEFATVDEVNTVLTNYVQIKDLPPSVNMSEYVKLTTLDNYALKSEIQKASVNVINSNLQSVAIPYRDSEPHYFLDGISNELKEAVKKYGIDVVGEGKNINTGEKNINISGHYDFNYETSAGYNFKCNSFELHFYPDRVNQLILIDAPYAITKLTSFTTKGVVSTFNENDVPSINYANENYVKTSDDSTINGKLIINSTNNTNNYKHIQILAPNTTNDNGIGILIGKQDASNKSASFYYREPGEGHLGMHGAPFIITWSSSYIKLNKDTTITGNLTVSGTITGKTNTTITHYCPVEENIEEYQIGKPVFMSGNVYKQQGNEWMSSCEADTTNCICSVKPNGTWKEFVGIITEIDAENNCITFATHGDYLFFTENSSQYQIGNVVLYDGTILGEDDALTVKIQQSIIGKVSAIIDEHHLAIFKD